MKDIISIVLGVVAVVLAIIFFSGALLFIAIIWILVIAATYIAIITVLLTPNINKSRYEGPCKRGCGAYIIRINTSVNGNPDPVDKVCDTCRENEMPLVIDPPRYSDDE